MQWIDFFKFENSDSKFTAELSTRGGYIIFSNSGKAGDKKHFTLSLDSFLQCLKDIHNNHSYFTGHEKYEEKEWRGLGSKFFTDETANAQITVQTKPMFVTLSKIIMWANEPQHNNNDPESNIPLNKASIENAIEKVELLAEQFTPDISFSEFENKNPTFVLDEFINWFTERDGTNHNYFSNNFSGSKDLLKEHLTEYENVYKDEFSKDIFTIEEGNIRNKIEEIESNLQKSDGQFFDFSQKKSNHMPRAILGKKNYLRFLKEKLDSANNLFQNTFDIGKLKNDIDSSGLIYSSQLITRFTASLLTKPFVILTGLSGSGKTKLAQAFVEWICQDEDQYCIIPVGADWTNRDPLLGYPNALKPTEYIKPDNGALDIIIRANNHKEEPHFLVLDEMNLSHVERYFADFLSVMESKEAIPLHSNATCIQGESTINEQGAYQIKHKTKEISRKVPQEITLPDNLFIIGTVNIDETTYMFSPKVLDRANTIEFRVNHDDMKTYLNNSRPLKMDLLTAKGSNMAQNFLETSKNKNAISNQSIIETLLKFFNELKGAGAEFGYRSASEMLRLINQLNTLDSEMELNEKVDIAIIQKLLPKLHGSRRKISSSLETLASFCVEDGVDVKKEYLTPKGSDFSDKKKIKHPLSLEKIARMYKSAMLNGYASFAEA